VTPAPAPPLDAVGWIAERCDGLTSRLDRAFVAVERRIGTWGACLAFGLLLLAASAIYTAPSTALMNHGVMYGTFATDPFHESLTSPIRLRPLSPWIAHFMFLRGEAFMAFPLIATVLFLAVIMRIAKKNDLGGGEAILLASLMAFTSPVLFTLHFAGYVDVVSYLFIAVAMLGVASDVVVAACICLAILNHDANLFVLPWLVFHAARHRTGWWRRIRLGLAVAIALTIVALVRHAIELRAPVKWAPAWYLNGAYLAENALLNVRGVWLGAFMAFKLFWFIPAVAGLQLWIERRRIELLDLSLAVLCGLSTLLITSDESRLPALAFPAVLTGAMVIRRSVWAPPRWGRTMALLVFVNLLMPQYYVGQSKPIVFFPTPVALVLKACGYDPWQDWNGMRVMPFTQ
jgi:hypothetical protein